MSKINTSLETKLSLCKTHCVTHKTVFVVIDVLKSGYNDEMIAEKLWSAGNIEII